MQAFFLNKIHKYTNNNEHLLILVCLGLQKWCKLKKKLIDATMMYKHISIHVFTYMCMPYTWSWSNICSCIYINILSQHVYMLPLCMLKKIFCWHWEYLQDLPTFPQFHPLQVFRLLLPAYDGEVYAVRISNFNMKLDR